jgi:hypothetical protein
MVYKREKTSPDQLKRRFSRPKRPTCLIVCEGHTEEEYFLIVSGRFTNVTIKKRTCPVQLVDYAIEEIKDYDSVICVFDKESHPPRVKKFEQAKTKFETKLEKAAKNDKKTIIGAWSIPCFEVWSLCHVHCTTKPFMNKQDVENALIEQGFKKQDWRDDNKQKTAITTAKKLCNSPHGDNPSTRVHLAVEHLKTLLET